MTRLIILLLAFWFCLSATAAASAHARDKFNYLRPLLADANSLRRQNELADAYDLSRMKDRAMIDRFAKKGRLIRVPDATPYFYLDTNLPSRLRYARPWVPEFANWFAERYYKKTGKKWKITSLVRDCSEQNRLLEKGQTIADCDSLSARSAHLTGAALDISRQNMGLSELVWMRKELSRLRDLCAIEIAEEVINNAFHIMILPGCAYIKKAPQD